MHERPEGPVSVRDRKVQGVSVHERPGGPGFSVHERPEGPVFSQRPEGPVCISA